MSLKGFDGWLVKPVRQRSLIERLGAEAAAPARANAPLVRRPEAPGRRALLAEDNDVNALVAERALRRLGFEIVRAFDGEEALRLASLPSSPAAPPFSLILMDLRMPRLDGWEAARRLRRFEAETGAKRTPIVALSANSPERGAPSPAPETFDAFLVKPMDFDALAATIERVCRPGYSAETRRRRAS